MIWLSSCQVSGVDLAAKWTHQWLYLLFQGSVLAFISLLGCAVAPSVRQLLKLKHLRNICLTPGCVGVLYSIRAQLQQWRCWIRACAGIQRRALPRRHSGAVALKRGALIKEMKGSQTQMVGEEGKPNSCTSSSFSLGSPRGCNCSSHLCTLYLHSSITLATLFSPSGVYCFVSLSCQCVFMNAVTRPAGTYYRNGNRKWKMTSCPSIRGANMLTCGRFFAYMWL